MNRLLLTDGIIIYYKISERVSIDGRDGSLFLATEWMCIRREFIYNLWNNELLNLEEDQDQEDMVAITHCVGQMHPFVRIRSSDTVALSVNGSYQPDKQVWLSFHLNIHL